MTFQYKGVSLSGAEVSGVIKALDEYEAAAELRSSLSIITKIEPVLTDEEKGLLKRDIGGKGGKVKDKELAIVCSQFSIVLKAGLSIDRCLTMVANQTQDAGMKKILTHAAKDVAGGFTLAQSLERAGGDKLPGSFIETVRAGEAAGTLDSCFERLYKYYDKNSKNKGKVSGALTYPIIVIVVAIVVFFIIMIKAVPLFTSTFADMGVELPGVTKGLMAVSNFTINWWWLIAAFALVGWVVFRVYISNEAGRRDYSRWQMLKAPMHNLRLMSASEQFVSTLCSMLQSGLGILEALEVSSTVVDNYSYQLAVKKVRAGVERGRRIVDCMRDSDLFPEMLTEMTGVGEESGHVEDTLEVVADFYQNEVELATARLLSIMEPAITIGLAVVVVFLLLAVYLPMFSLYGSI